MKEFLKNVLFTHLVVGIVTLPGCRNRNAESETTSPPVQESELAKSFKETTWFSSVEPEKQKQLLDAANQFEAKSNQSGWFSLRKDENNILKATETSGIRSQETFLISTYNKDSIKKETHLIFRSSPIYQNGFNPQYNKLKVLISTFLVDGVYKDFMDNGISFKKLVPKGNTTFEIDLSLTDEKLIEKQIVDQVLKLNAAVARLNARVLNRLESKDLGNIMIFQMVMIVLGSAILVSIVDTSKTFKRNFTINIAVAAVLASMFAFLVHARMIGEPSQTIDIKVE